MHLTLYHYAHCPFCVRVRMAMGYLQLDYHSVVLPYDDEATPIRLTGKKMLPILETDQGVAINESLDIIAFIDEDNKLKVKEVTATEDYQELDKLLNSIGSLVHSLAMPYWIWTPEFNESSRQYFQIKKELKRGPFKDLVLNQPQFIDSIEPLLKSLEEKLVPNYQALSMGLNDILIAAHVWGLYIVPEFQFSDKMHTYLQAVKKQCRFNYHQDFWS